MIQRKFPLIIVKEKDLSSDFEIHPACKDIMEDEDITILQNPLLAGKEIKIPSTSILKTFPSNVDLRSKVKTIYDQGNLGSCTANALCSAVQCTLPDLPGSRLFVYYNERKYIRMTGKDSGAYLSDGIKSLQSYGVCQEKTWPYVLNRFAVSPPIVAYTEAKAHVATKVYSVPGNMNAMKAVLNAGYPFVVGFIVYNSFISSTVARTGMVPMPRKGEKVLGGHAVLCVGYDDTRQVWILLNSWGSSWGDKGYFYMPYSYLTNSGLSSDFWAVQTMT